MLYQPSFISPNQFTNTGTIDALEDLNIGWQINGYSPLSSYTITIYQNDSQSTQMYTTGKITLSSPFYGKDALGNSVYFNATPISAQTLASAGIVNGYANGYKLSITQYWMENGQENSLEQSSPAFFITRQTPTIAISTIPSPLNARLYTVTATYTQAQGDGLNWVRWRIISQDNTDTPILDTGNIYGTALLEASYDGFFTGTNYSIRCDIQTENGIEASTGWIDFLVEYSLSNTQGTISVCTNTQEGCVFISWAAQKYSAGTASGNYTIKDNILYLENDTSVTFSNVLFDVPYSILWKGKILSSNLPVTVLESNDFSLTISSTSITLSQNSTTVFSQTITAGTEDVFTIAVTPTQYQRNAISLNDIIPVNNSLSKCGNKNDQSV